MLQTIIIEGETCAEVQNKVNKALSTITSDSVTVKWPDPKCLFAVIEYEHTEAWKNELCVDCQYFDESYSESGLVGICQEKGKRRRFNCRACEKFKWLRK